MCCSVRSELGWGCGSLAGTDQVGFRGPHARQMLLERDAGNDATRALSQTRLVESRKRMRR